MESRTGPCGRGVASQTRLDQRQSETSKMVLDSLLFAGSAVLALLLFAIVWWNVPGIVVDYYRKCKALRSLPGWPTHWFWGNLHQFRVDEATLLKYGDFVHSNGHKVTVRWMGPFRPIVSIHHCEPLRKVIKLPKAYGTYKLLVPWLGDGVLISEGHKWHRNRHLLTPAFHYEILKPYIPVYNSCLHVLLQKWSSAASRNEPVKLFDTISLLSLDIILQCAFNSKSDCQNVVTKHPYTKSVYELIFLINERFLRPLYQIDWLYFLTPSGRRYKAACRTVHEYSENIITERRKALAKAGNDGDGFENAQKQRKYLDFLDILLTATDEEGKGMTDLEIRDEVDTFMFEGHDTTTSGMCWTLYCLAKYPEHQEKVREEVRNVLMGREWLEYDDLKELKYTLWCIKEAMRLYPPVFSIRRVNSEDLELDGHFIPKNTSLAIGIFSIHHNPEIWENPFEFNPLRFHPDNVEGRDPLAYLPFSAGHRNCIGQNFARNEERVVVATVVNSFALSLVEDHKVEIQPAIVIRAKNDIKLRLEPLV